MQHVETAKVEIENFANKYPKLCQTDKLRQLSAQSGLDLPYIVVAVFLVLGIVLFVLGGASLVVNLVGFVYPAYASFKAIDSTDPDDDTQWLTYWVVYACFALTEQAADVILSIIPFYFFLKVGFLIWAWHPATCGAGMIYRSFIRPHLLARMGMIDAHLAQATAAVSGAADAAGAAANSARAKAKLVSQPTTRAGDLGMSTLTVRLVSGRDLPKMDRFSGKADPYAVCWVRPAEGREADGAEGRAHKQVSTTKTKNLAPEWDETFTFNPLPSTGATLVVELWDKESVGADDYMGQIEVPFEDVLSMGGAPTWFTLADPEEKTKALEALSGEVELSLVLA